jgi:hypothetical protein
MPSEVAVKISKACACTAGLILKQFHDQTLRDNSWFKNQEDFI